MDTKKKVVNQQPQKEEKKQNKLVAWWLGLNKWAKVGICAGTVAVLATAITLPIVLTNKSGTTGGDGGIIEINKSDANRYYSDPFDIKANYKYTFKLKLGNQPVKNFSLPSNEEPKQIKFKEAKLDGYQCDWTLDSKGQFFRGSAIDSQGTDITITVTSLETANVHVNMDTTQE